MPLFIFYVNEAKKAVVVKRVVAFDSENIALIFFNCILVRYNDIEVMKILDGYQTYAAHEYETLLAIKDFEERLYKTNFFGITKTIWEGLKK